MAWNFDDVTQDDMKLERRFHHLDSKIRIRYYLFCVKCGEAKSFMTFEHLE